MTVFQWIMDRLRREAPPRLPHAGSAEVGSQFEKQDFLRDVAIIDKISNESEFDDNVAPPATEDLSVATTVSEAREASNRTANASGPRDDADQTTEDSVSLSAEALSMLGVRAGAVNEQEVYRKAGALLRTASSAAELDTMLSIARDLFPDQAWPLAEAAGWATRHADWARVITFSNELVARFPEHAAGHITLARGLRETGMIEAARDVLQNARKRYPETAWPLVEQAWMAQACRDWAAAVELSRLIREEFPLERAGYMVSVHALRQLKRFAEAEDVLAYTISQPHFEAEDWPWVEGAWLAQQRADWLAGIDRAAQLRSRFPKHPAGYQIGAFCLRQLKKFSEAEVLLREALDQLAEAAWAFADYARLAQFQGNWAEAEARWERFRSRFPDRLEGYVDGAIASRHVGKLDLADDVLRDALGRFPNEAAVYEQYARVAQARAEWLEAERRWDAARQAFPADYKIALAYALLPASGFFHHKNDWEAALLRLAEFHRLFPDVVEGYTAYIQALCRVKKFGLAESIATEAIRHFPDDIKVHQCRGEIAEAAGSRDDAIAMFTGLITAFPASHLGYLKTSSVLCSAERFNEAEHICTKAMQLFPHQPEVFREFAEVAMRQHDWKIAHQRWKDAELKFPTDQHIRKRLFDVRLARIEEEEVAAPSVTHAGPSPTAPGDSESATEVVSRFESLGGSGQGCEFGIVQRLAGSEPLGLLRWSAITYEALLAALRSEFDGVGERDQTVLGFDKHSASDPEYITSDKRYGMRMHTFVRSSQITFDKMYVQSCRRIKFLRAKLIEDLRAGAKTFVFKLYERTLSDKEVEILHAALRQYGDNKLLYVRYSDSDHLSGAVERRGQGLYIGYIDHFSISDSGEPRTPNLPAWLSICRGAATLDGEAQPLAGAVQLSKIG